MKPIFEVTMIKVLPAEIEVSRITYRIVGMKRQDAVETAMRLAGDEYKVNFVIAGPRLDE